MPGEVHMLDQCDTYHARALVTWWHEPDQELAMCGHHSDALADALVMAEWVQMVDEREAWGQVVG